MFIIGSISDVGLNSIYLILAIINIQGISLGFDNKICILCSHLLLSRKNYNIQNRQVVQTFFIHVNTNFFLIL